MGKCTRLFVAIIQFEEIAENDSINFKILFRIFQYFIIDVSIVCLEL